MKRKFLLGIIPALMVLSACAGAQQTKKNKELFLEDTYAHEEIFGEAKTAGNLGVRKTTNPESVKKPKIGIQWMKSDDADNGSTTIDIRYVAAISSLDVQATWFRGVAKPDSNCPKKFYDDEKSEFYTKDSTIGYESINDGGHVTKATDAGDGYNFFVVYTLRNIPYLECRHGYMAAYLELHDSETGDLIISSDIVAVCIDQSHHFSFTDSDLDKDGTPGIDGDGYFIEGSLNGDSTAIIPLNDSVEGTDKAKKDGIEMDANDHFGVFKWTGRNFVFYGRYNFADEDTLFYTEYHDSYSPNYCRVGATGTFNITLDVDNKYNLVPTAAEIEIFMESDGKWDGGRYAIYRMDENNAEVGWTDMVYDSGINKHKCTLDIIESPKFILCRMNPDAAANNWDNKWTQTDNIAFSSSTASTNSNESILHNIFKITKGWWDAGDATYARYYSVV